MIKEQQLPDAAIVVPTADDMAKCILEPRGKYVVLLSYKPVTKTEGGLELPGVAQKGVTAAVVVGAGPLCSPDMCLGTRVFHQTFGGIETLDIRGTITLIHEDDILGIYTQPKAAPVA